MPPEYKQVLSTLGKQEKKELKRRPTRVGIIKAVKEPAIVGDAGGLFACDRSAIIISRMTTGEIRRQPAGFAPPSTAHSRLITRVSRQ